MQEEFVSEDLEVLVKKLWQEINSGHEYSVIDSYNQFYGICLEICEWQKEQGKKWLADNHRQVFNSGWEEGFEAGRDDMVEQMMKDGIDATVHKLGNNYLKEITADEISKALEPYNNGDKVKIIIIKED